MMTENRNTPREIVFDLEDTVGDIRRHAALLRCIVTDDGMDDVVRDALVQVANGLSAAHRDLHGKFTALFEQIVQTEGQHDGSTSDEGQP